MAWLTFQLGRPCAEISFDVNPAGMSIDDSAIAVVMRNLAGDLKKSTMKVSAPTIRINSDYLQIGQRNQFASLVGVSDSFLSFITRDDWEMVNELVTIIDTTHVKLQNSSMTRLSCLKVTMGCSSTITILKPFTVVPAGQAYGAGAYGGGTYGGSDFDPGAITYSDCSRIITLTNPLPDTTSAVYVSYLYTGWLVNLSKISTKAQAGWLDRFTYDFQLDGA